MIDHSVSELEHIHAKFKLDREKYYRNSLNASGNFKLAQGLKGGIYISIQAVADQGLAQIGCGFRVESLYM